MKKYIIKLLKPLVKESVDEGFVHLPYRIQESLLHNLFSYIGIARLEEIIEKAKKKDEKYIALAEMFAQTMRDNLAKENSDIIHQYHELLPKLNAYNNAFDKVIEKRTKK